MKWTTPHDSRVTPVGRFIRKTSIDEMPQFINVLRGDMSLVGPRPERPLFVEKFKEEIPRYMIKHQVRPGITGWAQVNGYREILPLQRELNTICIISKTGPWDLILRFYSLPYSKGLLIKMRTDTGYDTIRMRLNK